MNSEYMQEKAIGNLIWKRDIILSGVLEQAIAKGLITLTKSNNHNKDPKLDQESPDPVRRRLFDDSPPAPPVLRRTRPLTLPDSGSDSSDSPYDTSLQPDAVDFSDVGSAEQERRREAFSALIGSPSDDDSETANDPLDMLANVAASQMPDSEYITQLRRDDPAAYQRWISENPEAANQLARESQERFIRELEEASGDLQFGYNFATHIGDGNQETVVPPPQAGQLLFAPGTGGLVPRDHEHERRHANPTWLQDAWNDGLAARNNPGAPPRPEDNFFGNPEPTSDLFQ